jgi:hypothetical protein
MALGGVVPITPDLVGGDQYFRQKVGITDQNPNAYSDFKKANPGQDVFSINREWQAMTPEQRAPYLPQPVAEQQAGIRNTANQPEMYGTYQNILFGQTPQGYQPNFNQPNPFVPLPDPAVQPPGVIDRPTGNPRPAVNLLPIPNPFAKKSAPAPRAPTPRAPVRTPRRRSVQPPLMSKPTLGRR